ncbi:uncharacterized protein LOC135343878 isoform X2 [Halichondria panicea]|uniref:uncharacterized protein LOC135343878 isoform X2 n=1 Tax=Halichondria panicea TaxID=6063 RepID=UPI00312B527B
MGGTDEARLSELTAENDRLASVVTDLESRLRQSETDKLQVQASYEEALQALADSEAKRETIDKELKLAHDQISSMWSELGSVRKQLDNPSVAPPPTLVKKESDPQLELYCTICKERIKVQDIESHSRNCSTSSQSTPPSLNNDVTSSPAKKGKASPAINRINQTNRHRSASPCKPPSQTIIISEDYLVITVTKSPLGVTDLCPFKVITKTNMAHLPQPYMEVHRSQSDFQWLYDALQEACPERIVPPLQPPISLDATMSEFQRFLTRVSAHRSLRKHHLFIVFLTGTAEELRSLRAKLRPRRHSDQVKYKPAVGRDTNTGPLVTTKDYLCTLEQNILGLVSHLEQASRKGTSTGKIGHWFRAISDSEPLDCVTYLRTAASDLSRTCEAIESHHTDSDDGLLVQNLQSIAEYIVTSKGLLTRVEEAVDKFLYWDEEITILEAVTSSPVVEQLPVDTTTEQSNEQDVVFDDSGVSDVTTSSNNSSNSAHSGRGHMPSHDHRMASHDSTSSGEDSVSTSEKWAQASKYCADAKDYLEMMCHGLAEELSHFDLQKEKELKQVLVDYASTQQERHEKCQGKWFAMKLLLDTPVNPEIRAIQFSSPGTGGTSEQSSKT